MHVLDTYRRTFLAILVTIITVAFIVIMRDFLLTLLLAAVFTAVIHPVYRRLLRLVRGHARLAAAATIVVLALFVILPSIWFLGLLVSQAVHVSNSAVVMIQQEMTDRAQWSERLSRLPFAEHLLPYQSQIIQKGAEAAATIGRFVVGKLSDVTRGTVSFLVQLILLLYAMFFFLVDGPALLRGVMNRVPLPPEQRDRLVARFTSVSIATLKSTVVIGLVQGALGGAGFAVAGIPGAVFWGTMMTILAMIPGVGTALVWVPGAVFLIVTGHLVTAVVLALYFILVVGMVDNLLRPRLVGRGTQMHELLVLLSTLGGIFAFGVVGFILGPVIAALFITIWDIQSESMRDAGGSSGA